MLNIVHQFILNIACIRLALPCHTQLRGQMLFPTGNRVLRLLQTTVSPEDNFKTEQVCLIFFLSVFPFSPAGGSGAEAMKQGWGGPARNAWIRAGERGGGRNQTQKVSCRVLVAGPYRKEQHSSILAPGCLGSRASSC